MILSNSDAKNFSVSSVNMAIAVSPACYSFQFEDYRHLTIKGIYMGRRNFTVKSPEIFERQS